MLAHRLRRWPNIKTTMVKCSVCVTWVYRSFTYSPHQQKLDAPNAGLLLGQRCTLIQHRVDVSCLLGATGAVQSGTRSKESLIVKSYCSPNQRGATSPGYFTAIIKSPWCPRTILPTQIWYTLWLRWTAMQGQVMKSMDKINLQMLAETPYSFDGEPLTKNTNEILSYVH